MCYDIVAVVFFGSRLPHTSFISITRGSFTISPCPNHTRNINVSAKDDISDRRSSNMYPIECLLVVVGHRDAVHAVEAALKLRGYQLLFEHLRVEGATLI